ncbi:shikimate dehydrogenase family protein [Haliangium sp.]|uniref:shikimate dehydrogenase family protein n=1 Tax=Haliangium sp. TaxID=2663208 RepID=UPI003D0D1E7A
MSITARTRVGAVIGDPVDHSLSPALHNAAFAAAELDAVFVAWRVEAAELPTAVTGFRALDLLGVSVTVPHKQAVIACCDRLAGTAEAIGAVNCLTFERSTTGGRTRVVGHNTDAGGFVDALVEDTGSEPEGAWAVVLGAGGAARAVAAGLRERGAERVDIVARRPDAVSWAQAVPWTTAALEPLCRGCDLLVDCTPLALSAASETRAPASIPIDLLPDHAVVCSLVYHRDPALLAAARACGLATMNGAGMLVHQGARAFSLWTGQTAPVAVMWAALLGD